MDTKRKLDFVGFAREYCVYELGLNVGHAFEAYDDRTYTFYVLYWSPKTDFKLSYDFVGSRAQGMTRKKYKSAKNDVELRESDAVGGNGDCPVTKSLLESSDARIAYAVVHEKWHDSANGESVMENRMIEESAGNAMGFNECTEIVKRFHGSRSDEYRRSLEQKERHDALADAINPLVASLNELYESDRPYREMLREKRKTIRNFNRTFERIIGDRVANNADIADYYTYTALYPLTDDIYSRHGWERSREIFLSAMKKTKSKGFYAGVEELLKYSDLDKGQYRNVINVIV